MLLTFDLHEDLVDEEGIAVAPVFSFQASGEEGSEFDTPEPDGFPADNDASLSQEIFDISMAQVKAVVQPESIGNDIWRESVAFVSCHGPSLPISASLLGNTVNGILQTSVPDQIRQ